VSPQRAEVLKLKWNDMAKNVLTVVGALLILVGILGFGVQRLFGMHLGPVHNVIHLVSGALALYFGLKGTLSAARIFSLVFGGVYALLGLIGLSASDASGIWTLIPHQLALGMVDHFVHVALGGLFLFAGLDRGGALVPPRRNL
jgi:hypothetical protein